MVGGEFPAWWWQDVVVGDIGGADEDISGEFIVAQACEVASSSCEAVEEVWVVADEDFLLNGGVVEYGALEQGIDFGEEDGGVGREWSVGVDGDVLIGDLVVEEWLWEKDQED